MATCIVRERLLKAQIPPLDVDNTAPEAICRIPKKVPKMAAFDIVAVYHFTDEEFDIDYNPVYWGYTDSKSTPVQTDDCATEIDTSNESFTWVSWVEPTRELQQSRIWICENEHLICNELDPEFKKPGVPVHIGIGALQLPMMFSPVYTFSSSCESLSSFDVFISSIVISWEPPSWTEPSWEEPTWEEPTWEEPKFDWVSWEPEIPPTWWSEDFHWCESAAPEWYTQPPAWYKGFYTTGDTGNWCYAEPQWLDEIPANPDYYTGGARPDVDQAVKDALRAVMPENKGGSPCFRMDGTLYKQLAFEIDPDCVANTVCQRVTATFGIKKKCKEGNSVLDGDYIYRVKTVGLEFDPTVFQETDCIKIRIDDRDKPGPGRYPALNGVYFSLNPQGMFELDGSLSKLLKLEPEDKENPCSKLLFKPVKGSSGLFMIKNGQIENLPFPDKDSVLAVHGDFYWAELKKCEDRCKEGGGA